MVWLKISKQRMNVVVNTLNIKTMNKNNKKQIFKNRKVGKIT